MSVGPSTGSVVVTRGSGHEVLGVEQAEPDDDADSGDDPEADNDVDLGPAAEFEMVVERRHAQKTSSRGFEGGDLDDVADDLGQEQAAKDDGEEFGTGQDGQPR